MCTRGSVSTFYMRIAFGCAEEKEEMECVLEARAFTNGASSAAVLALDHAAWTRRVPEQQMPSSSSMRLGLGSLRCMYLADTPMALQQFSERPSTTGSRS